MLLIVRRCLQRYKSSRVCGVIGFVLLMALLAGCGPSTASNGVQSYAALTSTATSTTVPTTPTSTATSTSIPTPTPTVSQQMQNCGTVDTALNGQPLDNNQANVSGNCFWQAFQRCQAATLVLMEYSLDTKAVHTFTIENNSGTCSLTDTVKHYIDPSKLTSTTTSTCASLVKQADGLYFNACGSAGNIHLPL